MPREPASLILSHTHLYSTLIFICICINDTDHCASAENEEKKMTLAYIFWERFSHSRVLLNSSVWGLRFLSHCLHIPPTHFAYTARTSVFAFTDWQMERVVFDIYSDGLAYPQEWDWHDLRSFCAFLRSALAESPLNFLPLSLPSFHESPHPHPQHPTKPIWKPKFASLNISNFLSSHLQKKKGFESKSLV